ncbi:MAG: hypothetical protein KGP01_03890 [Actinomycetales bacterium]|nr:hypothetical protein [Actinomycetales bacterium]
MADIYAPPLRLLAAPTAAVGALAVTVAAVMRGGSAAVGAALGVAIVVGFFSVSHIVLGRVLAKSPELAMSAALALYLFKIIVLFVLLAVFRHATGFDGKTFGLTVLVCTVSWTMAEVLVHARRRVPYVTPAATQPGSDSNAD